MSLVLYEYVYNSAYSTLYVMLFVGKESLEFNVSSIIFNIKKPQWL
jgi:hypothetical protein